MKLALDKIKIDGGTQARAGMRQEVVEEYAALYKSGVAMPDVVVFADGTNFYMSDGFHRYGGARDAGLTEINTDVRDGTRLDALLFSATCNDKHGLRMSNADKRSAVEKIISEPTWEKRSDRWVAESVGVSNHFVATVREEMKNQTDNSALHSVNSQDQYQQGNNSTGNSPSSESNGKRTGKDGKERSAGSGTAVVYLCKRCSRVGVAACEKCKAKKNPIPNPKAFDKPPETQGEQDREPGVEKEEDCEPTKDNVGHVVPAAFADAFLADFDGAVSLCQKLQGLIDVLACGPGGAQLARFVAPKRSGEKVIQRSKHLDALKGDLKGTRPHSVCPFCLGKAKKTCKGCSGTGWVTKTTWDGCDDATKARLS